MGGPGLRTLPFLRPSRGLLTTFADLGLSPSTVQAVADTGYTVPTPIQEQAIPVSLAGRDVLGIAQTGTGKTAAFTLPMIDRLSAGRAKARMPRSLVVAPTRELADQVAASFDKYAKGTKLSWALLIGGVSFKDQEMKIDRGVDVLIVTPGRLLDFYERRKIMLLDVQTLVVDEADRMLDMGFIPDLEKIFEITPKAKQTLFFSATMPPEITRLTTQFLKDPTRIEVARPATTNENIKQFVAKLPMAEPKAKRMALRALIERAAPDSGIIFCNRKSEVDIVAKSLQKYGYDAAPIHGDLDQSQRMKTLEAFRAGELKLLVASDVAARGLDIPQVSDVFNYDVPHQADDYVHRIGRTGRAGRSGETFMIVTPADERNYDKVLRLTKDAPEEVVLELDWEEARRGAERDRERYGSGSGSGRGGRDRDGRGRGRDRDRDRERPVADHGQRASMEAISTPEPGEPAPVEERGPRPERAERGDRPRRDRGRRRDRNDQASVEAPPMMDDAADEAVHQPAAEPAALDETPVREERPRREERPQRADRDEGFARRGERDRERGPRGGRDRDRHDRYDRDDRPVVGFGGDTPAFLQRSAAAAIAALQKRHDEPEESIVRDEDPNAAEPDAEARTAEREERRPRRRRGRREEAETAAPEAAVVAGDAEPDDQGREPEQEQELELAVAAETQAAEAAVAEELAAKPKRTRRKKADVEAAPAAEAPDASMETVPSAGTEAEESPAKPKRTRRKKADEPVADTAAPADAQPAVEADAEPAKPKRAPRRRKAADAQGDAASEPSEG